jgi:DNA-binding PadR family transcriptional regulator
MTKPSHTKFPFQVEGILLGLIVEAPMHGYDLYKFLRESGGLSLVWHINQSNLYALLDKFLKEGYLTSELIIIENSHSRKDFSITPKGLEVFRRWMQEPVLRGRDMRQLFMAKLYFALKDGKTTASQLVEAQYQLGLEWKNEIQSKLDILNSNQKFENLVLQSRMVQVSGWLQFLELCKTDSMKTA